jgi:large subunit ribosomal protein L7/L12
MNVVNCTTRLPSVAGPYQVIVKIAGTAYSHKGIASGVSWNGTSWDGAGTDSVVAWVDPVAEVVVAPKVVEQAPSEDPMNAAVILTGSVKEQRIGVIKLVREITGLSLGDSKTFVDSPPKTIKDGLSIPEAAELAAKVVAAGGQVKIEAIK